MKVCFSVGDSSSKVIESMRKVIDDVEFSTYGSVEELVRESTLRHVFFDRIVFSNKIVGNASEDLTLLHDYLMEYSSSTSVVLICKDTSDPALNDFKRIFNSPMYTSVVEPDLTVGVLKDTFVENISTLKMRYNFGEIEEVQTVVGKDSSNSIPNNPPKNVKEPKKKGLFKGLFSQNKKGNQNLENQTPVQEEVNTSGNTPEFQGLEGFSLPTGDFVPVGAVGGVVGGAVAGAEIGMNAGAGVGMGIPVSPGIPNISGGFNADNFEDSDLSLGSLGDQHVDTGFLDEESEEEIRRDLGLAGVVKEESKPITSIDDFEREYLLDSDDGIDMNARGILLVTGDRGVGVTSYIAEYSVALLEAGKRVLVVDLDYKKNGILSFIDTETYMKRGYFRGIINAKPFEDGGIYVASNGYGFTVKADDVLNLLSKVAYEYDVVFIDCPIDCLNALNVDIIDKSNVLIRVAGNRGSIMSSLDSLTNREILSSAIEDALYGKAQIHVVDKISEYYEDLAFLRKMLMFGRYDWLSKLN